MRPIDADAIFGWYVKAFDGSNGKPKIEPNEIRFSMNDIAANLSNIPTIKSEIIRCNDCKHRDPEDKKCDCGHDIIWQLPRGDNWYCADAERRTDE